MTIDRAAWERRWKAAPELRPPGTYMCEQTLMMGSERVGGTGLGDLGPMLICWRAVEWLAEDGWAMELWKGKWRVWNGDRQKDECFDADTAIDALGAAVDAVLAGKEKP